MTNSIHPVSHRFESVVKNGIWVEEIQFSNFIAYQLVACAEARCWVVIYHLRFFFWSVVSFVLVDLVIAYVTIYRVPYVCVVYSR